MQKKQQKMSDNAALAGEKLGDLSKVIATQETAIEEVNTAMLNWEIELLKQPEAERAKWKASKESEKMLAAVATAAEKAGVDFSEGNTYDFTRCVKPSGEAYGTSGACKSGRAQNEVATKLEEDKDKSGWKIPKGKTGEDVINELLKRGMVRGA
jgi:hypothetical protein